MVNSIHHLAANSEATCDLCELLDCVYDVFQFKCDILTQYSSTVKVCVTVICTVEAEFRQ